MLAAFFNSILRALTPYPTPPTPPAPAPTFPASVPAAPATAAPALPARPPTTRSSEFSKTRSSPLNYLPPTFGRTPGAKRALCPLPPSSPASRSTNLPFRKSFVGSGTAPGTRPSRKHLPPQARSAPRLSSPSPSPDPRAISTDYPGLPPFVGYGGNTPPFQLFAHLVASAPPLGGYLPPPSFAFGPAGGSKMGETEPVSTFRAATVHDTAAVPPPTAAPPPAAAPRPTPEPHAASRDDKEGSEIPYFQLHASHLSVLRGHIKYLEILNKKKGSEGKLDKMITEYEKIVNDAKMAAVTAGIIRDDPKPTEKRKSRPSVTFADEDEIHAPPVYKKTKTKPVPTTILKGRRGNAGKRKPTAEAQATLRSCLGKRNRSNTETLEEDEEPSGRAFKKPRARHFQEGDPLGKYVGDPDTDDEDSDSDSFKSATSAPGPATPADGKTADTTSSPAAAPFDTKAAKDASSPTSPAAPTANDAVPPTAAPSVPTTKKNTHQSPIPSSPQIKHIHIIDDKPIADKSAKKQKQAPISAKANTTSAGVCHFAIRSSLPSKHTVDDEAGNKKSTKKQESTPVTSASSSSTTNGPSVPTSIPTAPATTVQSQTKRGASEANACQLNIKRKKKHYEI